jgi:hypothetical protein
MPFMSASEDADFVAREFSSGINSVGFAFAVAIGFSPLQLQHEENRLWRRM